ncbi:hypothetical protein BU23DRAFT_529815 [Bimuria novae-zelandiae CBS 107.79]|uniref:Uncharacterized protein n=1 Tax=Bimuria novae-zelandiae CBS 107.79 TaxID=1447943 RepID=A0A6A5VFC0_9PLEO|nr:hypothetical protein BU23DRAFT_529815 [Bimuria novae-zelandiae CBS 107.79]
MSAPLYSYDSLSLTGATRACLIPLRLELSMDIHKWLNETVLPQQPPSPHNRGVEHHALRLEQAERDSREKRKRKQSTSDSSLLDDPPQRKKVVLPERGNTVEEDAYEGTRTDASHPTSCSESSASTDPYKRKPRRKTRLERYEPVPPAHAKKRGTHTQRHKKGESKKIRRMSRRKKADKQGSGIVPSFQANNVATDRLTLKPREKLGLFNKGRVSSPVKGRGLPDLVFQEMKFLQKDKNQPEAGPLPGSPRKQRKKNQAHAKEDEISAYFTSVRPALAEQDSNSQAKEGSRQKLRSKERSERERFSIVDKVFSTIESVDKSSQLGFGGKGPRHESGGYISWSESVRTPSAATARLRTEAVRNTGQLDPTPGGQEAGCTDGGGLLHSRPAPPTVTKHPDDGSGGRFQVSSVPPTNERLSRSHSLPQHTSSPRRINLVDRAARRRTLDTVVSPSSMPPFVSTHGDHRRGQAHIPTIPKVNDRSLHVQLSEPTGHRDHNPERETEQRAQEEGDQQTSSSLGRILEDCNTAFHERRKAAALHYSIRESSLDVHIPHVTTSNAKVYPAVRRIPIVQLAGVEEVYHPRAPTVYGPSIYEQQEQHQYEFADLTLDPEVTLPVARYPKGEFCDQEELDDGEQEWDEEAEMATNGLCPFLSDGTGAQQFNDNDDDDDDDDFVDRMGRRSNDVVKPGFWRPHKLY